MVLQIGIVYNQPEPDDRKDRSGVLEAVKDISSAIETLGYRSLSIPVKDRQELPQLIADVHSMDCVFNLCEDFAGNSEGEIWMAGLLEMIGTAYTGSGPEALMLSLNKVRTKEILSANHISTPPYSVIASPPKGHIPLTYPLIIKPPKEDGSLGIDQDSVVYDADSLYEKCKNLLPLYPSLLVEEFIDGREINVAILNGEVIACGEVFFSTEPAVLTYGAKWNEESFENKATPVFYTNALEEMDDVVSLARMAFRVMGLRHYGRVDLRINKENKPFIIDVNPNPDISRKAGFAMSLKAVGMTYHGFIKQLISTAIEKNGAC